MGGAGRARAPCVPMSHLFRTLLGQPGELMKPIRDTVAKRCALALE